MQVTVEIADELAIRLRNSPERLPSIIEAGLRQLDAKPPIYGGLSEIYEALASLPTAEEVLALRPSAALQSRVEMLLERNRAAGLNDDERTEWEQYQYAEHLVRLAKAKALVKVSGKP